MLTLARPLAASPMETRGTGVLAGLAVEARLTVAGARGRLTGAVIVARALQEAGGSVAPGRAGQLTVQPCPAQATGAAAGGSMAQTSVFAGAHVLTVHAKPVLGTAVLAVAAGPPWGAGAGAGHRVTGCPLPTSAHMRTAGAEAALWTGEAAVCPQEASGAVAAPCGRVTGAPVEASTQLLTTRPKAPRGAPLPAAGAVVARSTHTGPRGRVAGLVPAGTLALLPTAVPKGAGWAGLLTARPSKACRTATLPSDVVAGSTRWALAALGAGLSKPAMGAGIITE